MKPQWMEIAEKEIGVCEVKGGENPRIIEYHKCTSLKASEDEVPWCASFINWCFNQAKIIATNSAAAISFATWGIKLEEPKEGCVCVIRQKRKGKDAATGSSSGNHVALFEKIEDGRIFLLGGNQSDSVKVSSFSLASYEVVAYRWPEGVSSNG